MKSLSVCLLFTFFMFQSSVSTASDKLGLAKDLEGIGFYQGRTFSPLSRFLVLYHSGGAAVIECASGVIMHKVSTYSNSHPNDIFIDFSEDYTTMLQVGNMYAHTVTLKDNTKKEYKARSTISMRYVENKKNLWGFNCEGRIMAAFSKDFSNIVLFHLSKKKDPDTGSRHWGKSV